MSTVFSKIIDGDLPCHKIAESKDFLAFLDITPVAIGHVLVVPKVAIDYFFDMPKASRDAMLDFSTMVAKAIKAAIPCRKVGVAIIGLEVPHAHIHLVPLNDVSDINFSKTKLTPSPENLTATADLIRSHLA